MASSSEGVWEATVQVPTAAASKNLRSDLQMLNGVWDSGAMLTSTSAIERWSST